MSRIAQRFWGGIGQRILDSGALDSTLYRPGAAPDEAARMNEYALRWAYYLNDKLYTRLYRSGLSAVDMPTEWNPIPAVAAFYVSSVLAGDMEPVPVNEDNNAETLAMAVYQVWRWSNFDTLRRNLVTTSSVLGDVFIKTAEHLNDIGETVGVYLQSIPPQTVNWWDADERDYLTAVRIDTHRTTSIFTGDEYPHTLVEVWRKDGGDGFAGVRYWEISPNVILDDSIGDGVIREYSFDELGYDFIPIVWQRVDTHWRRQVAGIDRYNALAWQAARMNRPLAVVNANATDAQGRPLAAPTGTAAGLDSLYTEAGDGVMGVVEMPGLSTLGWAGTPIDFAALNVRLAELREGVVDSLPEYRVATLRGIQIATETLQILLNQAEQRALEMRAVLERALSRADMMALSVAQVAGIAPSVFAAEVIGSYEDGRIEHEFTPRPVFEKSAMAKATETDALVKAGASLEGAARTAGYTDAEVEDLVNLSIATFEAR